MFWPTEVVYQKIGSPSERPWARLYSRGGWRPSNDGQRLAAASKIWKVLVGETVHMLFGISVVVDWQVGSNSERPWAHLAAIGDRGLSNDG